MPPQSRFSRIEKLLGGLDLAATRGLEIGALASPIACRPQADVRYVDHADTATLRALYANDPYVRGEAIVPVDAVWGERALAACFPGERFDYVIASQVIEHVPDLIGWLAETASVLRPGGRLVLAIPDKRYCYDVARRESDLADAIDAWLRGLRRPSARQVFDASCHAVDFIHLQAWSGGFDPAVHRPFGSPAFALAEARRAEAGEYVDVHCWVFTARSLLVLLDQLAGLGLLPFRIERMHIAEYTTNEIALVLIHDPDPAAGPAARAAIADMLARGCDSEGLALEPEVAATAPDAAAEPQAQASGAVFLSRLHRQVADLQQELAAAQRSLAIMRASTSWRITAPLRAIAARLGRRGA